MNQPYFTWTFNYLPGAEIGSAEHTQMLGAVRAGFDLVAIDTSTLDLSKAPVASPQFTGKPRGPTPAASDNSTQLATTEWVVTAMNMQSIAASDLDEWEREMLRAKHAYWGMN